VEKLRKIVRRAEQTNLGERTAVHTRNSRTDWMTDPTKHIEVREPKMEGGLSVVIDLGPIN